MLALFYSAYGWLITRTEAVHLKRSVTKTADDINIAHSGNKHAQLTQYCSIEVISFSVLIQNNVNGAINLQQLRNNMYYRSSHGSRYFVRKPKGASKIHLVRWPVLLESRASRLPTTRYVAQPIAIGSQVASRLPAPLGNPGSPGKWPLKGSERGTVEQK